jgi:DNA-directed RNA polymerase specialized sigma24 family protein
VAVRITRRHLQRKRRFRFGSLFEIDDLTSGQASPEANAELRQAMNLMARLTVDQRIVWVLFHAEEEDIDTIAARCGSSRATVKRRLQEARILLSEMTNETP